MVKKETKKEIKKEKNKEKKHGKMKMTSIVIIAASCFMLIKGASLQPQIIKNQDKIAELRERKNYEQKRGEEIDKMKQNSDSDEYIERIAREKLGMIRKDEILFVDINGEESK